MKQAKIVILALVVGLSLTSCYLFQIIGKGGTDAGYWDKFMYSPMNDARSFSDTSNRNLTVLPMRQMATPKHLATFKQYLDLKKEQGFTIYYETIDLCADGENLTNQDIDTLLRKYRRVVGVNLDRAPKSGTKYVKAEDFRKDYNLRSWIDSLGLITDRDHHIDMSLAQIVDYYQKNYKQINLTDSDFTTPLDASRYSPSDTVAHAKYYLVWEPRAQYIVDRVVSSECDSIIVVCSKDLMGYMLRPLFENGYRSHLGFGANEDFKKLSSAKK